jgi:hypothetical protein
MYRWKKCTAGKAERGNRGRPWGASRDVRVKRPSAAARNMPAYRIQSHTRHKSIEMVAAYIRETDK